MEKERFDYDRAVAELEELTARVEDPATGIDDIGKYISRADALVKGCREYLRKAKEKIDEMDAADN